MCAGCATSSRRSCSTRGGAATSSARRCSGTGSTSAASTRTCWPIHWRGSSRPCRDLLMPLSDAALESGLLHITAAVTVLFGLGFASGVYRRIAPSRFLADEERDKTLTLYASLVFAVLGGMLAATAAGWYLFAYCSSATCEPATASLWQNEIVSGLRLSASLYVDRLAAFFVLLISALSIGVSVYSFGWLAGDDQRNRVAGFYNLFVLALLCTVVVNHVFFLILALEVATLAFGYLI